MKDLFLNIGIIACIFGYFNSTDALIKVIFSRLLYLICTMQQPICINCFSYFIVTQVHLKKLFWIKEDHLLFTSKSGHKCGLKSENKDFERFDLVT